MTEVLYCLQRVRVEGGAGKDAGGDHAALENQSGEKSMGNAWAGPERWAGEPASTSLSIVRDGFRSFRKWSVSYRGPLRPDCASPLQPALSPAVK